MLKVFFATVLALLISTAMPVAAQQEESQARWFDIEVIVFERLKNNAHLEHWSVPDDLAYPANNLFFPSESNKLSQDSIVELDFNGPLAASLKKLNRSSAYRVLKAKRWRQGLLPHKQAPFIIFKGGDSVEGHTELQGSLQFSVERYLHMTTNLWFTQFGSAQDSANTMPLTTTPEQQDPLIESAPSWLLPALPEEKIADTILDDTIASISSDNDNDNAYEEEQFDVELQTPIRRIVTLRQTRRLRSTETHYIDHPLMGILVHILPVKAVEESDDNDIL